MQNGQEGGRVQLLYDFLVGMELPQGQALKLRMGHRGFKTADLISK
jgi:hypothetical protein